MSIAAKITAPSNSPASAYRAFSGRNIILWPSSGEPSEYISIRDIANNLAKTNYFPEANGAPFTAAQYALELTNIFRGHDPQICMKAFLDNAWEAYGDHRRGGVREAERQIMQPSDHPAPYEVLQASLQSRILQALGMPEPGVRMRHYATLILAAKRQLDATLERDLNASIHPSRSAMDERLQHLTPPLPRIIKPISWTDAAERYWQTYTDLAALCCLPVKG